MKTISNKEGDIALKNFDLLIDFNSYLVENPDVAVKIPRDACVVFETKDTKLNKLNRDFAEEARSEGESCFKATKNGKGWRLEKLPA